MSETKELDLQDNLYRDVCQILDNTRTRVATFLNTEICITNWQIGKRIKDDILRNRRAEYGKNVLKNLSDKLMKRYGKGWSVFKLQHCVRAAYTFSEEQILYAARTQLTWTHLRSLMGVEDELARNFYMEMCRIERWDTRTLRS